MQWDDHSGELQANIRIDWIYTPGSDFFVVIDTGSLTGDLLNPLEPRWLRRMGVVKRTYDGVLSQNTGTHWRRDPSLGVTVTTAVARRCLYMAVTTALPGFTPHTGFMSSTPCSVIENKPHWPPADFILTAATLGSLVVHVSMSERTEKPAK